jgi:hypothetical protein
MPRLLTIILAVMISAASPLHKGNASADGLPEPKAGFSADFVYMGSDGGFSFSFKGRINSTPEGLERVSLNDSDIITIARPDKDAVYELYPDIRAYSEVRMSAHSREPLPLKDKDFKLVPDGREALNGVATDRYKARMTDSEGSVYEGAVWVTRDGIVAMMDLKCTGCRARGNGKDAPRMIFELRNLKTGAQDHSLFEVPEGYERLEANPGLDPAGGIEDYMKGMEGAEKIMRQRVP